MPMATNGYTPLMVAADKGCLEAVQLPLAAAPEAAHAADKYGRTALHWAARKGNVDVMRLLLEAAPDALHAVSTSTGIGVIHLAAGRGGLEAVNLLLQRAPDLATARGELRWAPIHYASCGGQLAVEQRLLELDCPQQQLWMLHNKPRCTSRAVTGSCL